MIFHLDKRLRKLLDVSISTSNLFEHSKMYSAEDTLSSSKSQPKTKLTKQWQYDNVHIMFSHQITLINNIEIDTNTH